MTAVNITCQSVESISPGAMRLYVRLYLTAAQRRDAIRVLLGDIPEQDAFEFMRAEFPEWFKGEGA